MKKTLVFVLVLTLVYLAFFCSVSYAGQDARVIYVKGDVKINRIRAGITMAVKEGDKIITAKGSYIEIGFDESLKNNVKIDQNSFAVIKKITPQQIDINLLNGKIFSLLENVGENETFRIITPVAVVGVRGTGLSSKTNQKESEFVAFEDKIFVRGITDDGGLMNEVIVRQGWKAGVKRFGSPGKQNKISKKEKRQWRKWKRLLNKHVKDFPGKEAGDYSGKEKKFQKIIERTDSNVEKSDMEKIEKRTEQEQNGGREIIAH
ncbi:MAG: FecR family protein [Candidatus Omnitrophota bacterium]|nr:FecR family protein [Candidatus Omnitrophota bacterium]